MENASKALLIAAAVLIVILIIAFGMRIFNSTTDVSAQASAVGDQLRTQSQTASGAAVNDVTKSGDWLTKKPATKS